MHVNLILISMFYADKDEYAKTLEILMKGYLKKKIASNLSVIPGKAKGEQVTFALIKNCWDSILALVLQKEIIEFMYQEDMYEELGSVGGFLRKKNFNVLV
mmetsp:Transcript_30474/g.27722  ORF Transcript_30474/g.27722 Transcript_30474/m.27722 type:complete len:101 (+) Transcript_30474:141-443(+)